MAKGGKLTKLKSVIKRWHSFGKRSSISSASISDNEDSSANYEPNARDLHSVYVGKSRRQYFVPSNVVEHPLFRELLERTGDSEEMIVACEVVLFEHLLWMLENADLQPESLDDLVEFYSC